MYTKKQIIIGVIVVIIVLVLGEVGYRGYKGYKTLEEKASKVDVLQAEVNQLGMSYCKVVSAFSNKQVECKVENGAVLLP